MRPSFKMPDIYKFIKMATEEFENNNTRTEKFVTMENRIIMSKKPSLYLSFARYVPGADIERFQKEMLNIANAEDCYYFLVYVVGNDLKKFKKDVKTYGKEQFIENTLMPFFEKAITSNNKYWIISYLQFCKERGLLVDEEIEEIENKFNQKYDIEINYRKNALDFERTLNASLEEYKNNGRSPAYIENENKILSSHLANLLMYLARAPKANISKFANTFAKHGDLFFISVFVKNYHKILTEEQKSRLIVSASLALFDKKLYKLTNRKKLTQIKRLISKEKNEKKLEELKEILRRESIPDAVYDARNDFRGIINYLCGEVDVVGF